MVLKYIDYAQRRVNEGKYKSIKEAMESEELKEKFKKLKKQLEDRKKELPKEKKLEISPVKKIVAQKDLIKKYKILMIKIIEDIDDIKILRLILKQLKCFH